MFIGLCIDALDTLLQDLEVCKRLSNKAPHLLMKTGK